MVGLWFASSQYPDVAGLLLGIHTDYVGGGEGTPLDDDYEQVMRRLDKLKYPLTWEPSAVSPRVAAQHSSFVFGTVESRPYGTLALPTEHSDGVVAIGVDSALKKDALTFLARTLDVRGMSMFPDLDGFGAAFGVLSAEDPFRW